MTLKPPVLWCGGKRALAKKISDEIMKTHPKLYIEPFLGGGAVALAIPQYVPKVLSDGNATLMELWRCLQKSLIVELSRVEKEFGNEQAGYLAARESLNSTIHDSRLIWIRRSALFLYLNARCFNGLWRVNSKGFFNVPFGKRENPSNLSIGDATQLCYFLKKASLLSGDYRDIFKIVNKNYGSKADGRAIFIDSPYDDMFSDYTRSGFGEADQRELAELLKFEVKCGAKVWVTNNDTKLIREIYDWAEIELISERHSIGADGDSRGRKACVLIRA